MKSVCKSPTTAVRDLGWTSLSSCPPCPAMDRMGVSCRPGEARRRGRTVLTSLSPIWASGTRLFSAMRGAATRAPAAPACPMLLQIPVSCSWRAAVSRWEVCKPLRQTERCWREAWREDDCVDIALALTLPNEQCRTDGTRMSSLKRCMSRITLHVALRARRAGGIGDGRIGVQRRRWPVQQRAKRPALGSGARRGPRRHRAPAGAAGRWLARWAPEVVSPHGLKLRAPPQLP